MSCWHYYFRYLKQAAQAGRLEEVEMLEKNLMDIEAELKNLELATPRVDWHNLNILMTWHF